MYTTIRIAGRGGQGVKFSGTILGEAAIFSGHHASQTASYTPSTRGGPIHSDIIISDQKIECPYIETPDIFVVLTEKSWYQHSKNLELEATVIINSDIVNSSIITHDPDKVIGVPLETLAQKNNVRVNSILIGFLARILDLNPTGENQGKSMRENLYNKYIISTHSALYMKPKYMEKAIEKVSPERFADSNKKAFQIGYDYAKKEGIVFARKRSDLEEIANEEK